jgi:Zn finger protein HypA/HybF involved in hydrogenase expression
MTQNKQNSSSANKVSSYLLFIVLIVVALSAVAICSAVYAYMIGAIVEAGFLAIIGAFALTISCVVFYQTKRNEAAMKVEAPKVMTYIECKNCGTKTTRDFQRGDFVFKELEACPKCPEQKLMITGAYKEIKEKEKTYAV